MDKSDIEGLPAQLTPKLKASPMPFTLLALKQRYSRLPPALQISFQYALLALLWSFIFEVLLALFSALFPHLFTGFTALSAFSGDGNRLFGNTLFGNILFIVASALLIYLLLLRQELATPQPQVTKRDIPLQTEQSIEDRTDELSQMLDASQGVNAKLEGLLADQTATALENARIHAEAGQIAILEERQRLGRDLHDSVTQALYSMVLFADATSLALAAGKQPEATENLRQVRQMARQAMADMRLLIYQLHPPLLKEEGLAVALQTRLDAVESRAGLQTAFRSEGDCDLLPRVEGELYNIAQEALNNVIKHAKAEHVTIELNCHGKSCSMTIIDDGIGFDVSTAQVTGGVGLRSIAERAKQINARLTLESTPNQGTRLRVEV